MWAWDEAIDSFDDLGLGFVAALVRLNPSLTWTILRTK